MAMRCAYKLHVTLAGCKGRVTSRAFRRWVPVDESRCPGEVGVVPAGPRIDTLPRGAITPFRAKTECTLRGVRNKRRRGSDGFV